MTYKNTFFCAPKHYSDNNKIISAIRRFNETAGKDWKIVIISDHNCPENTGYLCDENGHIHTISLEEK